MCARPSAPPRSINAPKLARLLTRPLRIWPTCNSSSSCSRRSERISRSAARSERIRRLRRRSISMIFSRSVLFSSSDSRAATSSRVSSGAAGARLTSCDIGTNPRGPTSTSTPPLLNSVTFDSMILPSLYIASVSRHSFSCSARRIDSIAAPSPSGCTTYTGIDSPTSSSRRSAISRGSNSSRPTTTPSAFRPTSSITSSPCTRTTVPSITMPRR